MTSPAVIATPSIVLTVMVGVLSLVMLSVLLAPLSLAVARSSVRAARLLGGVVSIVKLAELVVAAGALPTASVQPVPTVMRLVVSFTFVFGV